MTVSTVQLDIQLPMAYAAAHANMPVNVTPALGARELPHCCSMAQHDVTRGINNLTLCKLVQAAEMRNLQTTWWRPTPQSVHVEPGPLVHAGLVGTVRRWYCVQKGVRVQLS